ncbi:hypothetical protein D3C80_1461400 [compost metagenome]
MQLTLAWLLVLIGTYFNHTTMESGVSLKFSEYKASVVIVLLWLAALVGEILSAYILPKVRFPLAIAIPPTSLDHILAE